MKKIRFILLIMLCALLAAPVSAKKKKEDKEPKQPKMITVNNMYAFGVCMSLKDSVVYLTDIQLLPKAVLEPKTKFLQNRADYSRQLKLYFMDNGQNHMTCAIAYDQNRKKLEKKFTKIYNKSKKNGDSFVKFLTLSYFSFEKPED